MYIFPFNHHFQQTNEIQSNWMWFFEKQKKLQPLDKTEQKIGIEKKNIE